MTDELDPQTQQHIDDSAGTIDDCDTSTSSDGGIDAAVEEAPAAGRGWRPVRHPRRWLLRQRAGIRLRRRAALRGISVDPGGRGQADMRRLRAW